MYQHSNHRGGDPCSESFDWPPWDWVSRVECRVGGLVLLVVDVPSIVVAAGGGRRGREGGREGGGRVKGEMN